MLGIEDWHVLAFKELSRIFEPADWGDARAASPSSLPHLPECVVVKNNCFSLPGRAPRLAASRRLRLGGDPGKSKNGRDE